MSLRRLPRARIIVSSILYLTLLALIIGTAGYVGYVLIQKPEGAEISVIVAALFSTSAFTGIFYFLYSAELRCPNCQNQLFRRGRFNHSESAKKFLGSYVLPLVFSILTFRKSAPCSGCCKNFRWWAKRSKGH